MEKKKSNRKLYSFPFCYTDLLVHIWGKRNIRIVVMVFQRMYWPIILTETWHKQKLSHYTPRRVLGVRMYSSYSLSASALDGGEWSASRPGRAIAPVPVVQEAGWASAPVWTQRLEESFFRLCRGSNLDLPVVQPVARHYTDWTTWLTKTWSTAVI
jgi:hypothetical protein